MALIMLLAIALIIFGFSRSVALGVTTILLLIFGVTLMVLGRFIGL